MNQSKTWKPMRVFVGAHPSWRIYDCVEYLFMLVLYGTVWCSLLLLVVSEIVGVVEIMLYPQRTIILWWHQKGWEAIEFMLIVIIFTLGSSLIMYLDTKRAVKATKGLLALMRAKQDQPPPVPLSEYIEVSMPSWLRGSQKVEIPDNAYSSFLRQIDSQEPWVQKLAAFIDKETETASPISILVTLAERITISVLGPNGSSEKFSIYQEQTAAIISLLAFQEKNAWVRRGKVVEQVYGIKEDLSNLHIYRLNKRLNEVIQQVGGKPPMPQANATSDSKKNKWGFIEYDEKEKENFWRLLSACRVSIYPELDTLDSLITAQNNAGNPQLDREILLKGCHQVMASYGKGLCAYYQRKHPGEYWHWAKEHYMRYRDRCLLIFDEVAKQELAYAENNKQNPLLLHESIGQAAQLYVWSLEVALGSIPNLNYAEKVLSMSLKLYRTINDIQSARKAFQTYATVRLLQNEDWQPSAAIRNIWLEAIAMPDIEGLSY